MSFIDAQSPVQSGPVRRAIDWMDERGPISWIALIIISFFVAGPLGFAALVFVLVTKRFRKNRPALAQSSKCGTRFGVRMTRSSGNSAFDAYKADTIARLEREQDDFESFLHRLRAARDKAEFDQYMKDRDAEAENEADTQTSQPDAPQPHRPQAD